MDLETAPSNGTTARPAPPAPSAADLRAHVEYLSQGGLDSCGPSSSSSIFTARKPEMQAEARGGAEDQEQLRAQHEVLTAPATTRP